MVIRDSQIALIKDSDISPASHRYGIGRLYVGVC